MIRGKIPNFFRLYLNPYVVQACYCLSKYVLDTWQQPALNPASLSKFPGEQLR